MLYNHCGRTCACVTCSSISPNQELPKSLRGETGVSLARGNRIDTVGGLEVGRAGNTVDQVGGVRKHWEIGLELGSISGRRGNLVQ